MGAKTNPFLFVVLLIGLLGPGDAQAQSIYDRPGAGARTSSLIHGSDFVVAGDGDSSTWEDRLLTARKVANTLAGFLLGGKMGQALGGVSGGLRPDLMLLGIALGAPTGAHLANGGSSNLLKSVGYSLLAAAGGMVFINVVGSEEGQALGMGQSVLAMGIITFTVEF